MTTLVTLSSGDTFYVSASPPEVAKALNNKGLVPVGGRIVNPAQVAQLTVALESPLDTPESLEGPNA